MNPSDADLATVRALWEEDTVARWLGIQVEPEAHDAVRLTMPVTEHLANGHGICHGGFTFVLADTALAYCCAAQGITAVTRQASITFIAPAHVGDVLVAQAQTRAQFGRHQIVEVEVRAGERLVAHFSGQGTALA